MAKRRAKKQKTITSSSKDDSESISEESPKPNEQPKQPQTNNIDIDNDEVSTEDEAAPSPTASQTPPPPPQTPLPFLPSDGKYHNKRRTLILSSRGATSRQRHLLEDLRTLIPHHKKEGKLDVGKNAEGGVGRAIDEICDLRGCNSVLYLESRKRMDAYLWIANVGASSSAAGSSSLVAGPSAKFLVENIHTMDELKLTGNCMKGSRPLLTFDSSFGGREELKLLKCLLVDVFGTPRGHPKSKPFVDRVMGFYYVDKKIWVRNYQIVETTATTAKEAHTQKKLHGHSHTTTLIEIGPRFVLNPIRIFRGSFGGETLYRNEAFVSPNELRSERAKDRGDDYRTRRERGEERKRRRENVIVPEDPLGKVFA